MLVTETIKINDHDYLHNYSDAGYLIEREGIYYADAIDPINSGRVYTETDIPIPDSGEEDGDGDGDEAAYAEAGKILMGVIE